MTKLIDFYAITNDAMSGWDDVFYTDLTEAKAALQRTQEEAQAGTEDAPVRNALYLERVSVPLDGDTVLALLNNKGPLSVLTGREIIEIAYVNGTSV